MFSPASGTSSTKQTNEQNRTRDLEIKNNLAVTRGEGEGGHRRKEEKGQAKEHEQGTHVHGQWGGD